MWTAAKWGGLKQQIVCHRLSVETGEGIPGNGTRRRGIGVHPDRSLGSVRDAKIRLQTLANPKRHAAFDGVS